MAHEAALGLTATRLCLYYRCCRWYARGSVYLSHQTHNVQPNVLAGSACYPLPLFTEAWLAENLGCLQ
jgi:hypothetical protein